MKRTKTKIAILVAALLLTASTLFMFIEQAAFIERVKLQQAEAEHERDQAGAPAVNRIGDGATGLGPITLGALDSTVYLWVQWNPYDEDTGKPVYEKIAATNDGQLCPAFVRLPDGKVTRWLTLDDGGQRNILLQTTVSGTAFIVNGEGIALTNKHIVAAWQVAYSNIWEHQYQKGIIYNYGSKQGDPEDLNDVVFDNLRTWLPSDGAPLFANDAAIYSSRASNPKHTFIGRDDVLDVGFPGIRTRVKAALIGASDSSDVGLIKIDATEPLKPLKLGPDDTIEVGDRVIALGYPTQKSEAGIVNPQAGYIPESTATEGIVSRLAATSNPADAMAQLDIFLSAGFSGGPVLNTVGHVIGIAVYPVSHGQSADEAFAVPVKHGLDLLRAQGLSAN